MDEKLAKIGLLLHSSFINELLDDKNVTDISYNGKHIYYLDNLKGRCKYNIDITNDDIYNFLRQISNLCDVSFSLSTPILDISFLNYRLNAVYKNIGRKKGEKVLTFCLRKFNLDKIAITKDSNFFTPEIEKFLGFAVKSKFSILIGGPTSSGKTELQKYLINSLVNNERIVVIDTINELDIKYNDFVDVTCLVTDFKQNIDLKDLVKLSLRYCPDYVVLAEARGAEFEDVLTSSLSGISTITTIHAKSIDTIIDRAINLVQINNKNLDYKTIEHSILAHFDLLIYVDKVIQKDGRILRRLRSLKIIYKSKIVEIYNDFENKFKENNLPDEILIKYEEYKKEINNNEL